MFVLCALLPHLTPLASNPERSSNPASRGPAAGGTSSTTPRTAPPAAGPPLVLLLLLLLRGASRRCLGRHSTTAGTQARAAAAPRPSHGVFVCGPLCRETPHESHIVYAPFPSHHLRPQRHRLASSTTAAAGHHHHHHHHHHKGGAAAAATAHGRNAAGAGGVGAAGKRGVSAAAAAAEDEEMKALVARHNKRFKAQQAPAYVPTLGVRDTRKVSRGFVFSLFVYVWG